MGWNMKNALVLKGLIALVGLSSLIIAGCTGLTFIPTSSGGDEDEQTCQERCLEDGKVMGSEDPCTCCPVGYPYYWTSDGMCHTTPAGSCIPTGCPANMPWLGCGTCWTTATLCNTRGTSNYSDDCSICRKCP